MQIGSRTEKMFPSHLSVNDLGVFAVVMVFGLIVVLLFMFDFVSTVSLIKEFRVFIRDGVQCVHVRIVLIGKNRVFIPSNLHMRFVKLVFVLASSFDRLTLFRTKNISMIHMHFELEVNITFNLINKPLS